MDKCFHWVGLIGIRWERRKLLLAWQAGPFFTAHKRQPESRFAAVLDGGRRLGLHDTQRYVSVVFSNRKFNQGSRCLSERISGVVQKEASRSAGHLASSFLKESRL